MSSNIQRGLAATLILHNGRIWTGDPLNPESSSIAIRNHLILAVGTDDEGIAWADDKTRMIDLEGRLVVPGFIDGHNHFLAPLGEQVSDTDFGASQTEKEFAEQVGESAKELPTGTWLTGGGWNHEMWPRSQLPTRELLDNYTPAHPVFLTDSHGHMVLVNSLALEIAGVTAETEDPPGGVVVKDLKTGDPTGVLKNNAIDLVSSYIPRKKYDLARHYELAQEKLQRAASLGITGISENLDDVFSLELYNQLMMNGDLTLRAHVYALIDHLDNWVSSGLRVGVGNRFLRFCGLKPQVDGALGSASAYFLEPYLDSPTNRGLLLEDLAPGGSLETRLRRSIEAGIQPMTHAVGDAAIRLVLDIYERLGGNNPERYRFRIEHAQHPHPDDIKRFGEMGIVVSVQPYSAMETAQFAEKRIGKRRCETTFPFRSFIDAGVVLAFGSDGFGDSFSPLLGIYAAVTRNNLEDVFPGGWYPNQKITVEEALRASTFGTAYACFYDDHVGCLMPGHLADLVVLDTDILVVEPEQIRDTRVLLTIFDGRRVWLAPEAPWIWPEEDKKPDPDSKAWSQQMP